MSDKNLSLGVHGWCDILSLANDLHTNSQVVQVCGLQDMVAGMADDSLVMVLSSLASQSNLFLRS